MLNFDETYYLQQHPDVAAALARGDWPSGLMHYCVDGKRKGRRSAPAVDVEWYLKTYPLVAVEVANGRINSPELHYYYIGKFRGYLPAPDARRPDNAAAFASKFGGLWTDAGNALDIVEGRLEIGQLTDSQASLLRHWITQGYAILPNAIPSSVLDRAEEELSRAYRGEIPNLRFAVHGVSENTDWVPQAQTQPAKALELHWFSQKVRDLIFSSTLLDFLHLIFERRVLASQSLGFWRGSAQSGHQDSAYVNYSLPLNFAASWIALEDVALGAGELFYHVGSHRMPDYLYAGRFKGAEEAKRVLPGVDLNTDYPRHIDLIKQQAEGLGLNTERFLAKRGDVLIWSADLAHGGGAISVDQTRKSIVTHYCPAEIAPAYFEKKSGVRILRDDSGSFYTSGHYG